MDISVLFSNPRNYKRWYELHNKIYESEKNVVRSFDLKDCLDVGSGPGIFHEVMNGYKVSIDISLLMLKESESDDKVLADALYMPFRNRAFKCVFSSVTVCFVSDVRNFIKEIERVTKKRAIICFIPRDSPWGEYYENLGRQGHKMYSHAKFVSRRELYEIINEYMRIKNVKSTLMYLPSDLEKVESVYNNDKGSFVCIEAIPGRAEPFSSSPNGHSRADPTGLL